MNTRRVATLVMIGAGALLVTLFLTARDGRRAAGPPKSVTPDPSAPRAAFPPAVPQIRVLVGRITPAPGRVEYSYTVVNGSAFPVTTLLVGWDDYYGGPTLNSLPLGWDGDSLPATSHREPPGWSFQVQPMEEEAHVAVTWTIDRPGSAIRPGETSGGFAVVVESADSTYDRGGLWTVYASGHGPFFGALQSRP